MAYTTINKSTDHFNTKLVTGNGYTTQAISGIGHQPDLVWYKGRNLTSPNLFFDAVRGANKALVANNTNTEASVTGYLNSFDSDGFTVGNDGAVNGSGDTYCSWNWKANGQGSANSDGTFATTYTSANQTAGFSISEFTVSGSGNVSFGHGLGAKPKLVITKSTSHTTNWNVYHEDTSASPQNDYLFLNTTAAKASSTNVWGTGMTTSVVGLGVDIGVTAGRTYVAYCFAEKPGYSKIGSYTGNGSADGTFIYTGFKPAWVMVKRTDSTNNWMIIDNKRTPSNTGTVPEIFADSNSAENNSTDGRFDYLSNGLKARGTNAVINASGGTYLYMAFAEAPLVGQNNVPATAR